MTFSCREECWSQPKCLTCGLPKAPRGRSVPLEMSNGMCDHECQGYGQDPKPGHAWSREQAEEEAARLARTETRGGAG